MEKNSKQIRKSQLIEIGLVLIIILLLWLIGAKAFFRVDLTSEKRYTLSTETKKVLKALPDVVYVKIYLEGELPAGFKKFRNSIKETLDEFRVYAGENLQYEFVNPSENPNPKIRNRVFEELVEKGLRPTNVMVRTEEGENSQKLLFPGAVISYKGTELPVNLLKNNVGISGEENLNNSFQTLEYELIKPIYNLSSQKLDKIAFLEGQGELNDYQVADITKELANSFQVDRGSINGKPGCLDGYKAIIVARPVLPFKEEDKLVLDQYIMNGGKVLWLVDPVNVNLDSLANGSSLALSNSINLDDQLFTYGARLNQNLVQDAQCNVIPINTAVKGSPAQFTPTPWMYYPLFSPVEELPITKGLNMIFSKFPGTIDTVGANGKIKKTPLLKTSNYTRLVNVPVFISLEETKRTPKPAEFNAGSKTVALLLEGQFPSVFRNRVASSIIPGYAAEIKKESVLTKMIVIADGDLIENEILMTPKGPVTGILGYDKYTRQTFGNKDFLLNCVQYLTDEAGLMSLRAKEFKLRLLDKQRIRQEKTKWQLVNTILPVLLVILFGLYYNRNRISRYGKQIKM